MWNRVGVSCKGNWSRVTPGETSVYKYTLEYITTHFQKKPERIG